MILALLYVVFRVIVETIKERNADNTQ